MNICAVAVEELNGTIESQRREIDQTLAGDEQFDEINNYFINNSEAHMRRRWKNWSDFKGPHSMNFREED